MSDPTNPGTPPSITAIGPFPARTAAPDDFETEMDAAYDTLEDFPAEQNALATWQTNALTYAEFIKTSVEATQTAVNASTGANVTAAQAAQTAAEAARDIAEGFANYRGDYNAGTLYAIGESVTYSGAVYVKKSTAAAGTTPVDGADWRRYEKPLAKTDYSGATQEIDFSAAKIHVSTADAPLVTYTFANAGSAGDITLICDVGLSGFDLSSAAYDSVSFSVSAQETTLQDVAISSDGTKIYVLGSGADRIFQYTLSTAFDVSTASYDSVSLLVSGQDSAPNTVAFSPNGTKMYVLGSTNDRVFQYTLATAWDLSTASYDSVSFSVASQSTTPFCLALSTDGTKMYVGDLFTDKIFQYTLATAWDLSTASYDSTEITLSAGVGEEPRGLAFSSDGASMFVLGGSNDTLFQYTLSTAWDLSTASYSSVSFALSSQDTNPYGFAFSQDGRKIYVMGDTNDRVFQYTNETLNSIAFPGTLESDTIPAASKIALRIVTTDGGTSYQAVSVQEISA